MTQAITHQSILGVILAGGQNRRMQTEQPKWQLEINNIPILEHIVTRLQPQVDQLVLNGWHKELAQYQQTVIADASADLQGPLAGLLAGLTYARQHRFNWVATCPCDSPFVPLDYVQKLAEYIHHQGPSNNSSNNNSHYSGAIIRSNDRTHPVFGLWSTTLYEPLKELLETTDHRGIGYWACKLRSDILVMDYPASASQQDPFTNINTPEDWLAVNQGANTYNQT